MEAPATEVPATEVPATEAPVTEAFDTEASARKKRSAGLDSGAATIVEDLAVDDGGVLEEDSDVDEGGARSKHAYVARSYC